MESRIPTVGGQNVAGHLAAASARTHWSGQINGCKRDLLLFSALDSHLFASSYLRTRPLIRKYWLAIDASTLITVFTLFSISSLMSHSSSVVNSPRSSLMGPIQLHYRIPGLMERMRHHLIKVKFPFINGSVEPTSMPRFDLLFNRMFLRLLLDHERCSWWYQWLVSWGPR